MAHSKNWTQDVHNDYQRKRWNKRAELLRRWKRRKGCANCGYNENGYGLQLDHIDPTTKVKNDGKGNTKWKVFGMKRLKEELSKCRVLCATCHMVKTWDPDYVETK